MMQMVMDAIGNMLYELLKKLTEDFSNAEIKSEHGSREPGGVWKERVK